MFLLLICFFNPNKTLDKTTQKTTQKILELIKQNPNLSIKEIALAIGNISEEGVKYHFKKLKKNSIIEHIGPDKGGFWKIIGSVNTIDTLDGNLNDTVNNTKERI